MSTYTMNSFENPEKSVLDPAFQKWKMMAFSMKLERVLVWKFKCGENEFTRAGLKAPSKTLLSSSMESLC